MPEIASIFDLMRAVRAHPDFVFGTIFVRDDFPDGEVEWESGGPKWAEEFITEAGFTYIENNAKRSV